MGRGGGGATAAILGLMAGGEVSIKSNGKVEETGGSTDDTPVGFMSSCPRCSILGPN